MGTDSKDVTGEWDVTNEEYHADCDWIGSTMLKTFLSPGPMTYHGMYVAQTMPRKPRSFDLIFGSAVHTLALEPSKWTSRVAILPPDLSRTPARNADKAIIKTFKETHPHHDILSDDEEIQALAMARSAKEDPFVRGLLSRKHKIEHSLRWHDPVTGLPCKCRCDLLAFDPLELADFKTSKDPTRDAFSKDIGNLLYDLSLVHYAAGVQAVYNGEGPQHIPSHWVAIGKSGLYETYIHHMTSADRKFTEGLYRQTLVRLKGCYDYNDWRPKGYGKSNPIRLPGWRKSSA